MKIQISNSKPSISESDILELEARIGAKLPDDYRRFILKWNGGISSHGFPFEGSVNELVFYSDEGEDDGIRFAFTLFSEHSHGFLPIAGDMLEQEYLLPLQGQDFSLGRYLYETGSTSVVGIEIVSIAASFSDFIEKLVPVATVAGAVIAIGATGNRKLIKQYVVSEGNSIDDRGENDLTILCEAIKSGNAEVVSTCIELGADTEDAVLIAAMNRRCDMLKLLYELGVDINQRDEEGDTALQQIPGPNYAETRMFMRDLGAKTSIELA